MIVYEGAEGQRQAAVTLSQPPAPPAPAHRVSAEVEAELEATRLYLEAVERVKLPGAVRERDAAQAAFDGAMAEKQALIADLFAHKTLEDDRARREGIPPRAAILVPSGAQGALASLLSDVEKADLKIQAFERQQERAARTAVNDAEEWIRHWRARQAAAQQRVWVLEDELRRVRAAEAAPPPVPESVSWRRRLREAFGQLGLPAPPALAED